MFELQYQEEKDKDLVFDVSSVIVVEVVVAAAVFLVMADSLEVRPEVFKLSRTSLGFYFWLPKYKCKENINAQKSFESYMK